MSTPAAAAAAAAKTTSKQVCIHVCGWTGCKWYSRAASLASSLSMLYPARYSSEVHESATREQYREALFSQLRARVPSSAAAEKHTASPFVYLSSSTSSESAEAGSAETPEAAAEAETTTTEYVGGCDAFVEWARDALGSSSDGLAQDQRFNDDSSSPRRRPSKKRMVDDGFRQDHKFEYDVVVIGGGSGGLACSKEMARLGAKVAVLDFVRPSPQGTTWGLGGTCVNVGCIPKKLMHQASLIGETLDADAEAFGWTKSSKGAHDWDALVDNVQNYIKSLNFQYRVALREAGVTYLNKKGTFIDAHTLELTDKKGQKSTITSARFIIAVGGRPSRAGILNDNAGAELCVDSDDLFSLESRPGKVLCVGGGYIALECGGFLAGLGCDVACAVRTDVALRGFDRECVDKIVSHMRDAKGVDVRFGARVEKIEKIGNGKGDKARKLRVTFVDGSVDEFDTVLLAAGRAPDTSGLGLENVPGALDGVDARSKKLVCELEQVVPAPHLYAVGDVVHGRPELTPVAIEAGTRLARRLFGASREPMDYETVATTVFTPLEYGTIGLSEEAAVAKFGDDNVDVYVSEFAPLEHALSEKRDAPQAFAKLVVDTTRPGGAVVGFHYLGPNAGELTQGFALAMRKGATYEDFVSTVGIHPTVAEEFTTLSVTKRSGLSAAKGGC